MADLPLDEAVQRFLSNEKRVNIFINSPSGEESFQTSEGQTIAVLQKIVEAALLSNGIYPDVASGVAALADEEYFSVPSSSDDGYLDLFRRFGTTANYVKTYPSLEGASNPVAFTYGESSPRETGGKVIADLELDDLEVLVGGQNIRMLDAAGKVFLELTREAVKLNNLSIKSLLQAADIETDRIEGPDWFDFQSSNVSVSLKPGRKAALVFESQGVELLTFDTENNVVHILGNSSNPNQEDVEPVPDPLYVESGPSLYFDTTDPIFTERVFQGIPSIARTGSRLWCCWYGDDDLSTSGFGEGPGNFAILGYSDDSGATWAEHGYIKFLDDPAKRVFDIQAWTDPDGKLWVFFAVCGGNSLMDGVEGAWAVSCKNPEGEIPNWSTPWRLSYYGVPMQPVVINEQVYVPIDYWGGNVRPGVVAQRPDLVGKRLFRLDYRNRKAEYHSTLPANIAGNSFDETNLTQLFDGRWLAAYRTTGPTEYSISEDDGKTWTASQVWAALGDNPSSRVFVAATPSGRLLVCYNASAVRDKLTVAISEDGGDSFPFSVLIDARGSTSYPGVTFGENGEIYVTYDYNRTSDKIVYCAVVNEPEIIAGTSVPQLNIVSDK